MIRIVKTDGIMPVSSHHLALLDGLGAQLVETACLTEDALIAACADADALLVLREPVSAHVIASLGRCRVISRFGVGLDTIDVAAATAAGIAVANVPDSNIDEVSTHALAMILSCVRRLDAFDEAVREGRWDILAVGRGMRRAGRMTLGLIGFGRVGRLVARKASAFGFRVLVSDPYADPKVIADSGCEPATLDALIAGSHIVSLHIPLTAETTGLIGRARIAAMRPGVIVINVSRGGLIDEMALAEALTSGHVGAAGIDAFEREPVPLDSPLLSAPNAILTPHAAHYSAQSLDETVTKAFANVVSALRGEPIAYQVNRLVSDAANPRSPASTGQGS